MQECESALKKKKKRVRNRPDICASDSDAGGLLKHGDGDDEDGDDGDIHNGGIHFMTL